MPGSRKPLSRADVVAALGSDPQQALNFKGKYDPEQSYVLDDGVTQSGHTFRAARDVAAGIAPLVIGGQPQNTLYWTVEAVGGVGGATLTQSLIRSALIG